MKKSFMPNLWFHRIHPHTFSDFSRKKSPRLRIVCNTFAKGEWGKEERKSNPYKKGDDIDIRIRAHDSKFQIFVDQRAMGF
ncbi:galactoside-binding lectin [Ancylostoma caninum]|uniref:Galectin n=1 Tax=Ancylostoma caninum TaxID=29170 RepID=A0A368G060_ANCCA|nr:galactoside-binding lectin [Ancylostoma caninum]